MAKIDFKNKVESKFITGNIKQAWEGLNILIGRSSKKSYSHVSNSQNFINDLNIFLL